MAQVKEMSVDEHQAWQLYFAENPFPGDALADQIAAGTAFLESAWTKKAVRISKHRVKYERQKTAEELGMEAEQAAGNLATWGK